jgi:hypothetical protein
MKLVRKRTKTFIYVFWDLTLRRWYVIHEVVQERLA